MTAPAAVAETHSAVVVFLGDRAYKIKKPVDLGFLDFRTRASREAVCHWEVELNRRMAPDVYLGVADVSAPDGSPCEHMVVMRRLPADRRLSSMLRAGAPIEDALDAVAHQLAAMHARQSRRWEVDDAATAMALAERWRANTESMLALAGSVLDRDEVSEVGRLAARYLRGREPLFDLRIAAGRACDGHGDLQADDVFCLDDGPRVLDCLEFDDLLRWGDGLGDAAFLAMDLDHLGRPELAARFLDAYGELTGDHWPASLAHHHVAYRAQVRAKVMAIRADQGGVEAGAEAVAFLALARSRLEQGRIRLVLVGGLPGTGKSTLATGVAGTIGATLLRSDVVRKELAGDSATPAGIDQGLYDPHRKAMVYDELLRRARTALGLGQTVVLDAAWLDPAWREHAADLAVAASSDLVELRCDAPPALARSRIEARSAAGEDPSDATPAVYDAMAATLLPWPGATRIDTTADPAAVIADVTRILRAPGPSGRRHADDRPLR